MPRVRTGDRVAAWVPLEMREWLDDEASKRGITVTEMTRSTLIAALRFLDVEQATSPLELRDFRKNEIPDKSQLQPTLMPIWRKTLEGLARDRGCSVGEIVRALLFSARNNLDMDRAVPNRNEG